MTLPANKISNLKRRVNRARQKAWPKHTCPASRHLHMIADYLSRGNTVIVTDDPQHVAESIYAVLESLWKSRMK